MNTNDPAEKELTGYPSIDKPWLKYYDVDRISKTEFPDISIYEYIYLKNEYRLGKCALMYFNVKISYYQMFLNADRIAAALVANGIQRGDSILVCMSGTPETVELVLACSKIGACAIMINPTLEPDQISDIITGSSAKIFICMDKLFDSISKNALPDNIEQLIIVPATQSLPMFLRVLLSAKEPFNLDKNKLSSNTRCVSWSNFIKQGKKDVSGSSKGDMPLAVVFSSGTTGKAKGIVHTNSSYIALSYQYELCGYPFESGDKFLYMIPTFIAAGLSYTLLVPLSEGLTIILDPVYSEERFISDLIKYNPNIAPGTKSFWYAVMNDSRADKIDFSKLKLPVSGVEPVTENDEKSINNFLLAHNCSKFLYLGWGMSEQNATITATAVIGNSGGSAGIPLPHVVVSAFDVDTGKECTYNQYGELRVISPCTMKEYYNNPQATAEFFVTDENGVQWCHSGDIGYINKQGEVFVLGRATDCYISSGGKRVYCFDVEHTIMEDEDVEQCKILDIDFEGRKIIAAHIIPKKDCSLSEDKLILKINELCRSKLTSYSVPDIFKVREAFPLTPNGKRDIQSIKSERNGFKCVQMISLLEFSFDKTHKVGQ